jgi:hypothetical protein
MQAKTIKYAPLQSKPKAAAECTQAPGRTCARCIHKALPLNKPSDGNNQSDAGHNAQFYPVLLIKAASLTHDEVLSTYNEMK